MSPPDAKKLIKELLENGTTTLPKHAREEMANDNLDANDVRNVLRGGTVGPAEFRNGSWRYQVETSRMTVVVAFRPNPPSIVVVTAWRKKR